MWRIATAIEHGTVEWWYDPRARRPCLRNKRTGALYDIAVNRNRCFLRLAYAIPD